MQRHFNVLIPREILRSPMNVRVLLACVLPSLILEPNRPFAVITFL